MAKSRRLAAKGYQDNCKSAQRIVGEMFIQADVCPQPGEVILDLGCGTGELSFYLAELVGPEGKVVGVDSDHERISLAQQSHSEVENLSFVKGDDSNFPGIGFETYDIIFCNVVLHWIPNKQKVFENMFRSLKEGGKIGVQYFDYTATFISNAFTLLNPENEKRFYEMLALEPKTKVVEYCSSAAFAIVQSYEFQFSQYAFDNVDGFLKWLWSSTHGVFDLSHITEERLQRYMALYPFKKPESTICRLVAVKPEVKPRV